MGTTEQLWQKFACDASLSGEQLEQFKRYYTLLIEWNEKMNLTALTKLSDVIAYHFQDSLALADAMDMQAITSCADIGTGAGFPIIPLKIKYPHLVCTLIEVNHKKITFLQEVINMLNLDSCTISDLDWRTFLRHTDQPIDLFCARASLWVPELMRMFKPACTYRTSQLIYWASNDWQPLPSEMKLIDKEYGYSVGNRKRKLIFFSSQ